MSDMKSLQKKLETNPVARTRFLADLLGTLERSGVDIQDPKVLEQLNLNLDLRDGKKFLDGLRATTNIITIVG